MQDQPLVSIITPTYNHEQFIGQCIESVLAQTYTNWEQIIINDGSTDKTSEVIKTYNDRRIRYIYQENVGIWKLNETYNKALALANGELIAVLEGDDFWPPDKLDVQAPYFVNRNVVLTFGKLNETNTNGCAIATHPRNWNWFPQERSDVIEKLILSNSIGACTAMCRKSTLYEIGGFQQHPSLPAVDYPTWLELSLKGDLLPIDHILGCWRRHDGQITDRIMVKPQIAENRSEIPINFLDKVKREQIYSINLTSSEIQSIYDNDKAYAYFFLGREELTKNNWPEARKNFNYSLNKGNCILRLGSLVGLLCALTRTDMEWMVKLFHKLTLSNVKYNPDIRLQNQKQENPRH
jgi:glycosyltransferase involved in cell wall biosynthesis